MQKRSLKHFKGSAAETFRTRLHWLLLLLTALALAGGCGLLGGPEDETDEETPDDKFDFIKRSDSRTFKDEKQPNSQSVGEEKGERTTAAAELKKDVEKLQRSLRKEKDLPKVRQAAPRFYEDFIVLNADEMLDVKLTFNSTPLIDAMPAFADVLGFNFAFDPDVRSSVTLNIDSKMTRRELWECFDAMLSSVAATAIKSGPQLLKIIPTAKNAMQSSRMVGVRRDGSVSLLTRKLKNVRSAEAVNAVRPFLTKGGNLQSIDRINVIVVSDEEANIPKLAELLEIIDQPMRKGWPSALFVCQAVKPSRLAQELADVLPVLGFNVLNNTTTWEGNEPGAVRLSGIDRLQVLVVTAATQEAIDEIRHWVDLLDHAQFNDQEQMYIYKVSHGKARDLGQALSMIFSTQGSALTTDASTGNKRTEQLNASNTRLNNQNVSNQNRNTTNLLVNTQVDRHSSIFDTPVHLFADGINNRLIIRTTPRTYALMKAMLQKLDVVPPQVLFQILIAEIELKDGTEFGVEFSFHGGSDNFGISGGTNYGGTTTSETAQGMKVAVYNPNDESKMAAIRALATRNKTKIISAPQIVVTSNTESKIQVGQEVPLLTSDISNNSSASGTLTRAYNYKSTGVILTLTPQVTGSDLIMLEIEQTISKAVENDITTATDTPIINTSVLKTNMTIANGKTMVIGGMIQESKEDKLSSIPIIADIPVLRRLLGNTTASTKRTELLVLVTGYIIGERSPVEEMIRRYNTSVKTLSNFEDSCEKEHKDDLEHAREVLEKKRAENRQKLKEIVKGKKKKPADDQTGTVKDQKTEKQEPRADGK